MWLMSQRIKQVFGKITLYIWKSQIKSNTIYLLNNFFSWLENLEDSGVLNTVRKSLVKDQTYRSEYRPLSPNS